MIDVIVDSAFKALKHIRLAEEHMLHQDIALYNIKVASYYMTLLRDDNNLILHDRIAKEYDKMFKEYTELYHTKPNGWNPKHFDKND